METRAHNVAVGGFVLTVVFLAFVAVLWLGRVELGRGQFQLYDIYFKGAVTGLSEGSPVLYNGVRVGRVVDIRLNPANVEEVRVTVEIDKNAVIKTDAQAELVANLLSGQSFIQIRGGTQAAAVLTAKPGERYPVIASERSALERVYTRAPRLLDRLTDIADKLNDVLNSRNQQAISDSLQNVRTVTQILADRAKQLDALISAATGAVGMLHALLDHADQGLSGPHGLQADAARALGELHALLDHADQGLSGPHGLQADAARALGDFDRLAKNLDDTNRQIQSILAENRPGLREFSRRTLAQIDALIAQTQQFIAGLSRLANELEQNPTRLLFGDRREGYRP